MGVRHPTTLNTMNSLAVAYNHQGKYREAEILYKQCLAKRKIILGESHPHTLGTMSKLVEVTSKLNLSLKVESKHE